MSNLRELCKIKPEKQTFRISSWDKSGRNSDFWQLNPGETCVWADIEGPGIITHIWSSWSAKWRDFLLKFTWDDANFPSIFVPFGDFFGLGHGLVNSYQSFLFSASANQNNVFNKGCAYNCYVQMPFKKHAKIELINQSDEIVRVWFYVDYENCDLEEIKDYGYFHAEFKREVPFGGWGHEIAVNQPETDTINIEEEAWNNNYCILQTKGTGHYIGCNFSITNLHDEKYPKSWWGEGDEMIWIDGYKWPPDIHGTGSEDYFNQGWGMQPNKYMRCGSSIYEFETEGYQTCYVHHLENPIRFKKDIRVTIEIGHGNHLRNEISSVAYWYSEEPTKVNDPPAVEKRKPILKKDGIWIIPDEMRLTTKEIVPNEEMINSKRNWKRRDITPYHREIAILSKNSENQLCLNINPFHDNSNLFEIPIVEVFEEQLNQSLLFNIFGKIFLGKMVENEMGNVEFYDRNNEKIEGIEDLFENYFKKRIKITLSSLLDDEIDKEFCTKFKLEFTSEINFRDTNIFLQ